MGRVLTTKELVRVTFQDGDFERLMKQTYTDNEPFFYVTKGLTFTRVETANHDLKTIISQLEKEADNMRASLQLPFLKDNDKARTIYKYFLHKKMEFIKSIKQLIDHYGNDRF
jgi:hypothetical protein